MIYKARLFSFVLVFVLILGIIPFAYATQESEPNQRQETQEVTAPPIEPKETIDPDEPQPALPEVSPSKSTNPDGHVYKSGVVWSSDPSKEFDAVYSGSDLTKYTAPNGNVTNLTYNTQHDVLTMKTAGVTSAMTYDAMGNVINTKLTGTGTSKYIVASSEISDDGNYTKAVYDELGNGTTYNYRANDGYLSSVVDANGTTTNYTYYNDGRAKQTYISSVASILRTYTNGSLSRLQRKTYNGSETVYQYYNFESNAWGQTQRIAVGEQTLASYEYEEKGGNLTEMTYGNGDSESYTYDEFDRVVQKVYNDTGKIVKYYYNSEGVLARLTYGTATATERVYVFEYDSLDRLIFSSECDGNGAVVQRIAHKYDQYGRLEGQSWRIGNTPYSESYTYDDGANGDGSLKTFTTAVRSKITYYYDGLRRLTNATVTNAYGTEIYKTAYGYKTVSGNQTSTQVQYFNVRNPLGGLISGYKYAYDAVGNITMISHSESPYYPLAKYEYDCQNQLIKETCYDGLGNTDDNITAVYDYTYDTAGNIRTVSENGTVTQTYSYSTGDWKDLLVSVNGRSIAYDGGGNPYSYPRFEDNVSYYMQWNHGRQLTYLDYATAADNETQIRYAYDADGIRTSKTVTNGTTTTNHTYVTQNGKVVRETIGTGATAKILDFIYDASGRPFALKYTNGTEETELYYYILNLQGDVVALMDASRNIKAQYTYNAWGEVISVTDANDDAITSATHIGNLNPLRYRGYYYDVETGFYYLQSRYYDPAMHRFINADSYASTDTGLLGYNMYAYCNNNPINLFDPKGDDPWWAVPYWSYIHNAVQEHILTNSHGRPLVKEGWVLTVTGLGRVDIYDPKNNEIWEVKSSGPASLQARSQLERYERGVMLETGQSPKIGEEKFYGIFDKGMFRIAYWTTEPGVILYKFWFKDSKVEEAIAVVACATLLYLVAKGAGKVSIPKVTSPQPSAL